MVCTKGNTNRECSFFLVEEMAWDGWKITKSREGGDVRAFALSWDGEWGKAKNVFFGFFPLAPTVAQCAPLTSLAARKKSRFAEKKSAPPKKNFASGGLCYRCYGCYSSYRGDSGGGGLFEAPGDGAGAVGGAVGGH